MYRNAWTLLTLFLTISIWIVWARWPTTTSDAVLATGDQPQIFVVEPTQSQAESPMPIPPTPPPPMPTPSLIEEVTADWQTFTSPYWGVTFRYPPGWAIEHNGKELGYSNIALKEERGSWLVGPPLELYANDVDGGRIYLSIGQYLLSDSGSLAEWVMLRPQYSGAMGRMSPPTFDLYTIPAALLPAGVEQGIYTIQKVPLRTSEQVWLTYNGLVFDFYSVYNRPEDMARIFAIMSSMQFTPIPEERLRASNSFEGDENTLRQQIADAGPIEPPCDWDCQMQDDYNMRMQALHDAMIQPPWARPMMQAVNPALDDGTWLTYTQEIWGISFRYPSYLTLVDTVVEKNSAVSSALQGSILLRSETYDHYKPEVLKIELFPYTVSADVPLHNWEAIQDQLNRALHPNDQFRYRLPVPIDNRHIPQAADDIVHTRQQAAYYQLDTFWASKESVVFRFTNNDLNVLPLAAGIFASVEFDTEQLAKFQAANIFAGDEHTMLNELAAQWAKPPTPTPDPLSTATPYPTITPRPTATPTPTPIRVTVTPSAFESPLVNGLKHHQGLMEYSDSLLFDISYDPTKWQLATYAQAYSSEISELFLAHQSIKGCEIHFGLRSFHAIRLAPITLAGRAWSISYPGGNGFAYSTNGDGARAFFFVELPGPLPDPYDPANKSQCELDAEAVFDTLIVVDEVTTIALPTVTPTP